MVRTLMFLPESQVTLHPLPSLTPATPLPNTKAALSFAIYSAVQYMLPDGKIQHSVKEAFDKAKTIPTLFTQLVVGCRRKIAIYSWRDGEAQDVRVCTYRKCYLARMTSPTGSCATAFATGHRLF